MITALHRQRKIPMNKIEAFCEAIQKYEGWYPFSRSWRNNNPGNLISSPFECGTDGRFAKFRNYASGWLALVWDVARKSIGQTRSGLGPESTIQQFFNVWAPYSDGNDSLQYAKFVADRIGASIDSKLKEVITI